MIKFYMLRHGQTVYNTKDMVQGWNDSPLSETGIFQARCAGYGLRKTIFSEAYSGLCDRQYHTAELFLSQNERPCTIIRDIHFNEMCYGKYEDGTYYEMLSPIYEELSEPYDSYPGLWKHFDNIEIAEKLLVNDETGRFEGPQKTAERVISGLNELISQKKSGNILISTSSMAIMATVHRLFPDHDMSELTDNASVTIITYDDGFILSDFNDTAYRQIGEEHFSSL